MADAKEALRGFVDGLTAEQAKALADRPQLLQVLSKLDANRLLFSESFLRRFFQAYLEVVE